MVMLLILCQEKKMELKQANNVMWVSSSVCRRVCRGRVCLPEYASLMVGEQTSPLRCGLRMFNSCNSAKAPLKGSRERKEG